jgi:hypothetical protein
MASNLVNTDLVYLELTRLGPAAACEKERAKLRRFTKLLLAILIQVVAFDALAVAEFPARVRLMIGSTFVNPTQINDVTTAQGLNKIETVTNLGVEFTTPVWGRFEGGLRYFRRSQGASEVDTTSSANDYAELRQDAIQAVGRFPLLANSIFRFDVVGGIGGANTSFKIKAPGIDGEAYNRASYEDGVGSFMYSYGASFAIGYKWLYFMLEAGMEQNKISSITRTGTMPASIQEMDLSGNYLVIGLLLDGMRGTRL